jgi:asparagine synthase (glutamine-hydrolysing)
MCGIFGIFNFNVDKSLDKDLFKASLLKMKHRGPDAHEIKPITDKIILGHVRLSIIDISAESNQPFVIDNNYWIVFNGEIYNYIEIRNELIAAGYIFKTKGDTEVLIRAYEHWGRHCVNKFNGDWAFAIYNIKENSLFCSRDRFGVKPFNYAIINNQFVFSSEIKAIIQYFPELKKPNYNVISNYCRNGLGAQAEQTWFEGINRLLPAHNLTWNNGVLKIEKYWDYPTKINNKITFSEAKEKYKKLFINAVELRMRSDVEIGSTLSSGIDSSSIVSVLRNKFKGKHNTFTAVFDELSFKKTENIVYKKNIPINEVEIVKKLTSEMDLDSHLIQQSESDFTEKLKEVIYFLESGHSSPAIIPLSNILKYAKTYTTVVLEGQGADELLGGYIINTFPSLIYELFKKGNFKQAYDEYKIFKSNYSVNYSIFQFLRLLNNFWIEKIYSYFNGYSKIFGDKLKKIKRIKDYPIDPPPFDEFFNKQLFKSHTGGLVNLLHYGDALSMSHSIESRLPFMDVNLVEFGFSLPFNFKMKNGMGKYIHREALRGIVPDYILNEPIKFGFNTPLSVHFNSLNSEANIILLSKTCLDRGIFDKKGLTNLIIDNINNKKNTPTQLYRYLSVEIWFRTFID